MRIGIVGGGVVGGATAKAFMGHVDDVVVYDVDPKRATAKLWDVLSTDTDLIFVCLPTPQRKDGLGCDTSALDQFFTALETPSPAHKTRNANFVIKSTVPIGYTRKARLKYDLPNLVHSPEFLTARTAVEDAADPIRNIIGYPEGIANSSDILWKLYKKRWRSIPCFTMLSDESEFVKLFQNALSALKVSAFNEARTLADKGGMDWERIVSALLAGGWVNPMHTQVPGPDGQRGFGGACFPKDLANFVQCQIDAECRMSMQVGGKFLNTSVFVAAHNRNRLVDRPETRGETVSEKRTGPEWEVVFNAKVMDPDGWRARIREYDLGAIPFETPITVEEFAIRWSVSTCKQPPSVALRKVLDGVFKR